jgi:hypothetical protein
MKRRDARRVAAERIRLLEMEATLQRTQLAATFAQWEMRKALARGTTLLGAGFRLFAQTRIRWLIATSLLAPLRRRRSR